MKVSRLCLLMVIFAVLGLSYGFKGDCKEWFEDGKSNIDLQICTQKTKEYNKYSHKMKMEVSKNPKLTHFKERSPAYFQNDIGDLHNCEARTELITPYMLYKRNNNSTHYVVQGSGFEQKFNVTRCKNICASCLSKVFGEGNTRTSCREETSSVGVYIYSPQTKKLAYEHFEFPVSCTCMIRPEE